VQYPHRVRNALASHIFRIPEHRIRVIAGDIGGAFGTKGWQYVEHRLVLWAARKLGRPVRWASDRSEAILADEHARDNISDAELANKAPTAPYRGAGRPEAIYGIERLLDDAALELGLDRIALRRRNLIPAAAMPYRNALGATYDSGDFPGVMEAALQLGDVAG